MQYLTDLLGVPLTDFAWGGAYGGGLAGSTVDNSYTPAKDMYNGEPVLSTQQQIFDNYTQNGAPYNIDDSLQLTWIGQNGTSSFIYLKTFVWDVLILGIGRPEETHQRK